MDKKNTSNVVPAKVYSEAEYNQLAEAYTNAVEINKKLNDSLQRVSTMSICIELLKLDSFNMNEEQKIKNEIFTILGFNNEDK